NIFVRVYRFAVSFFKKRGVLAPLPPQLPIENQSAAAPVLSRSGALSEGQPKEGAVPTPVKSEKEGPGLRQALWEGAKDAAGTIAAAGSAASYYAPSVVRAAPYIS